MLLHQNIEFVLTIYLRIVNLKYEKNETKIQMQRTLLPFHTLTIWFRTIDV